MVAIPWGLDSKNSYCPWEFDFGIGAGPHMFQPENLEKIMSKFEGTHKIVSHG